jgi:hypothetical protein
MLEAFAEIASKDDPLLAGDPSVPANEFVGLTRVRASKRTPTSSRGGTDQ